MVHDAAAAAACVENLNAGREAVGQSRHERQDVRLDRREHRLPAVLAHHGMETSVFFVRDSATLLEALDDVIFHASEHPDPLGEYRHVVGGGCTAQERGMLRRQFVAQGFRIDLDNTGADHGAEPFPNISLVQLRAFGNFLRSGWRRLAQDVEKSRAVANGHHQAERPIVEGGDNAAGERLGSCRIEISL